MATSPVKAPLHGRSVETIHRETCLGESAPSMMIVCAEARRKSGGRCSQDLAERRDCEGETPGSRGVKTEAQIGVEVRPGARLGSRRLGIVIGR